LQAEQGIFYPRAGNLQGISGDLRLSVFDAVRYNLCQGKFPDNREFNREFFDFRPFSAILARNLWAISMACSKIPYETEQGIFLAEQGIFSSEQGILGRVADMALSRRGWGRSAGRPVHLLSDAQPRRRWSWEMKRSEPGPPRGGR
jgi:hypothetical protein